jgi:PEP-CTERM motif
MLKKMCTASTQSFRSRSSRAVVQAFAPSRKKSCLSPLAAWPAFLLLLCLATASVAKADPITVTYTASQLSPNMWEYQYQLTGSYLAGDDLAIYFPVATSSDLSDLGTGGSDWTTFDFQPDPSLPADGEFDLVSNIDDPSLTPIFAVAFQYSGPGSPGVQSFALFDSSFDIIDSGLTRSPSDTPAIPEPNTFLLLGSGMVGLVRYVERRKK